MSFYPDATLFLVCQEINAEMYMSAKHDQEYRISDVYILTIIYTSYLIVARLNSYIWYTYSITFTQTVVQRYNSLISITKDVVI